MWQISGPPAKGAIWGKTVLKVNLSVPNGQLTANKKYFDLKKFVLFFFNERNCHLYGLFLVKNGCLSNGQKWAVFTKNVPVIFKTQF
jgi:hypothetical protein